VLGVLFNQNLNWSENVYHRINSCQKVLHGLKLLRKYFTQDGFKNVMTSFLFSKLFYAFEVWSYDLLKYDCKIKLNSFYYKCCRIIINDFDCIISRHDINCIVKRATPSELSEFCKARTVIKAYTERNSPLKSILDKSKYNQPRKPERFLFFDQSTCKISKNSINNRVSETFKSIQFNWSKSTFAKVRTNLKKTFFGYMHQ